MAGQFRSVLDVRGWDALVVAARDVVASAGGAPMAVLVQPLLRPAWGGVLFGADPVTGRADRLVVSAVPGGPDRLVSGAVSGSQMALSPRGRLLGGADVAPDLRARRTRRALVGLARQAAELFGSPQDIEWAITDDGELVLLQSRPITALARDVAQAGGPTLGPGPVAETFPAPLSALEEELWIPPLREGVRRAIQLTGAVSRRQLRASPVVVTVQGRPAADLDLLGLTPRRRSVLRVLDPRGPARRLRAAWLVGRLRAGLPGLATDVLRGVDERLRAVPALDQVAAGELLDILERSAGVLVSLHGHEVLAGQLLDPGATGDVPRTAASDALRLLARLRADEPDATDDELVARHPVLLSLVPPAIAPRVALPPAPGLSPRSAGSWEAGTADAGAAWRAGDDHSPGAGERAATVREALRLRVRWVHELTARAAAQLGVELARRGVLARAEDVRHLGLDELRAAVAGAAAGSARRSAAAPSPAAPPASAATPLPAAFRLAPGDLVVPVATNGDGTHGQGAGGGRGSGPVHRRDGPHGRPPPDGAVLVVPTLDPGLAAWLPRLGGLVAETGSVLSHLAILAREHGVPTVVALPGAVGRYRDGTMLVVDGTTGEVTPAAAEEGRAA